MAYDVGMQSESGALYFEFESQVGESESGASVSTSSTTSLRSRYSRDWCDEFQTILDMPASRSRAKFLSLRNLVVDFNHIATQYGRIIIEERALPDNEKTVKRSSAGGVAGGEKYIVRGILFKFAVDTLVGPNKIPLYGDDEYAAKAASHDLKGLTAYFNADVTGLRVPLMTLIDYRGLRLQAISLLPITRDTIVYGSSDGARTMHCDDAEMNQLMAAAAKRLNLKAHMAGPGTAVLPEVVLHSAADIEGHKVGDRYYLLDFARTAPPQAVTAASTRNAYLYRLLRFEFVKEFDKPLSSDAFSSMTKDNRVANAEIVEATEKLFTVVIPHFAVSYVSHIDKKLNEPLVMDALVDGEVSGLSSRLHRAGINVRHIGRVRARVTTPEREESDDDHTASPAQVEQFVRRVLLLDALARVSKCKVRALWRDEGKNGELAMSSNRFDLIALDFFNRLLLPETPDAPLSPFWRDLAVAAADKFEQLFVRRDALSSSATRVLSQQLTREQEDEIRQLPKAAFVRHVLRFLAIGISPGAMLAIQRASSSARGHFGGSKLALTDVTIGVRVQHMGIVDYADAQQLMAQAFEQPEHSSTQQRL
jgi:hypothetical protein